MAKTFIELLDISLVSQFSDVYVTPETNCVERKDGKMGLKRRSFSPGHSLLPSTLAAAASSAATTAAPLTQFLCRELSKDQNMKLLDKSFSHEKKFFCRRIH